MRSKSGVAGNVEDSWDGANSDWLLDFDLSKSSCPLLFHYKKT
jgi:hypothetical protein